MVKGQKWVIAKSWNDGGKLADDSFKLEEFDLPGLKDGEVLLEAKFFTVDPYMRMFARQDPPGKTILGEQVAKVTESKNSAYPVGTHVLTSPGWVTHSISNGEGLTKIPDSYPKDLPLSLNLGILGMPGRSAYYGLIEVGKPKKGETVFVSSAAGAVGSVVGQLAKILGCRVVGSAGSDEKVAFVKKLGFDDAFNYKTVTDLDAAIKKCAPDGVDVYFDNVGGELTVTMINNMNSGGRIAACGCISEYNVEEKPKYPSFFWDIIGKELRIQGFVNYSHPELFPKIASEMTEWIKKGQLKYEEVVSEGFANMPKALMGLFSENKTGNMGKVIIKV